MSEVSNLHGVEFKQINLHVDHTIRSPLSPAVKPILNIVMQKDALRVTWDPMNSSRTANHRRDATKFNIAELLSLINF